VSYPQGFTILQEELWRLSEGDQRAFWAALCRSRWWRPRAFRQALILVGAVRITEGALGRLCAPDVVVATLEALVEERQLSRAKATRIEETMLASVQATGHWRGDPAPETAYSVCYAPDVWTLAQWGTPP
jgi:hypothetical protein